MPPNGLVIYCGTIVTDEGKEKKVDQNTQIIKLKNMLSWVFLHWKLLEMDALLGCKSFSILLPKMGRNSCWQPLVRRRMFKQSIDIRLTLTLSPSNPSTLRSTFATTSSIQVGPTYLFGIIFSVNTTQSNVYAFMYSSLIIRGSDGVTSWRQQIWFHRDGRKRRSFRHTSGLSDVYDQGKD